MIGKRLCWINDLNLGYNYWAINILYDLPDTRPGGLNVDLQRINFMITHHVHTNQYGRTPIHYWKLSGHVIPRGWMQPELWFTFAAEWKVGVQGTSTHVLT